ncbi:hypothetical protein [Hydrogenophaga sp.]|uniref:hypothetical protein n=1 Tax=Hydrogenophaga sp. TaxID=1904254 RepID=UPI00273582DC|nr:hypothetical protein [Hydrogenophaga sp.]MDP1958528.1 hypothetical protein [Methylotenera sp.]
MLSFSLDIEWGKKLLPVIVLSLISVTVNADEFIGDTYKIPNISSEYFSSMRMKPRFWLTTNNDESANASNLEISKELMLKVIDGEVNVPEYALRLVKTKDHTVRLDRLDN